MKKFTLRSYQSLFDACQRLSKNLPRRPILISIDGRSGSGKSSFGGVLRGALAHISMPASLMHFDRFWTESDEYRDLISANSYTPDTIGISDHYDWGCFKENILIPMHHHDIKLISSNPWINTLLGDGKAGLCPEGAIIIEGFSINREELRDLFDIRVHIDLDEQKCLQNAIRREGFAHQNYYSTIWRSMEDKFFTHDDPRASAHFVISNLLEENTFVVEQRRAV